jgi:DNA-directed RNA polymerase subunit RPC12/RpoP
MTEIVERLRRGIVPPEGSLNICKEVKGMDKITVITPRRENWEYRCQECGQLRFFPSETKPVRCGECGTANILVGRPGTLPPVHYHPRIGG